jgi:hypothetical protein
MYWVCFILNRTLSILYINFMDHCYLDTNQINYYLFLLKHFGNCFNNLLIRLERINNLKEY